jgi:hypothetical protein
VRRTRRDERARGEGESERGPHRAVVSRA